MNPDPTAAPTADAAEHTGPTGPRTQEGKDRCRFNAVRHGLTGQNVVFTEEESEIYGQHSSRIQEHYLPIGPIEEHLVGQIADCIWRTDRAASIDHGIFALSLEAQKPGNDLQVVVAPAKTWRKECKELTLLTLYVRRIDNKLAAHKAELKALQAERREATKESRAEAATSPQPPTPSPQPLSASPQPPARTPVSTPESVFSPVPSKPAPVPIKPEIHVPGPDLPQQPKAA